MQSTERLLLNSKSNVNFLKVLLNIYLKTFFKSPYLHNFKINDSKNSKLLTVQGRQFRVTRHTIDASGDLSNQNCLKNHLTKGKH